MDLALSITLVVLLGLALGSFITCISYRIPKGLTFLKGRSICPNCEHEIAWYDNIPVLSYVLLGGKCRNCKKHISLRYPLIEVLTAVLFVLTYYFYTQCSVFHSSFCTIPFPLILFDLLLLVSVLVIDLENTIIPDEIIFTGLAVNFLIFFLNDMDALPRLFSAFLCASFLLGLHLITKGKGMGLGDVKFALLGGLLFVPISAITWLFLSFMIGAFVGVFLILLGKAKFGAKIAFGPYLVIALIITLVLSKFNLLGF